MAYLFCFFSEQIACCWRNQILFGLKIEMCKAIHTYRIRTNKTHELSSLLVDQSRSPSDLLLNTALILICKPATAWMGFNVSLLLLSRSNRYWMWEGMRCRYVEPRRPTHPHMMTPMVTVVNAASAPPSATMTSRHSAGLALRSPTSKQLVAQSDNTWGHNGAKIKTTCLRWAARRDSDGSHPGIEEKDSVRQIRCSNWLLCM